MWLRNCHLGAFISHFWTLSFCKITLNNCFIFSNNANCNTHTHLFYLSKITLAWLGRKKLSNVTSCTELTCRYLKKRGCDGSFLFPRSCLCLCFEQSFSSLSISQDSWSWEKLRDVSHHVTTSMAIWQDMKRRLGLYLSLHIQLQQKLLVFSMCLKV